MAEQYTVLVPVITGASFSVNPVNMNGSTVLSVVVTESAIILEPEIMYSGEIYSGEV